MSTEYEDALSEMNTILEKENEALHAKVNALETKLEAINEKRDAFSTREIRDPQGRVCMVATTDMLVYFYEKAQPLVVLLAKRAKVPLDEIKHHFNIDLRFGERVYDQSNRPSYSFDPGGHYLYRSIGYDPREYDYAKGVKTYSK